MDDNEKILAACLAYQVAAAHFHQAEERLVVAEQAKSEAFKVYERASEVAAQARQAVLILLGGGPGIRHRTPPVPTAREVGSNARAVLVRIVKRFWYGPFEKL